jgi:hypothetical protein
MGVFVKNNFIHIIYKMPLMKMRMDLSNDRMTRDRVMVPAAAPTPQIKIRPLYSSMINRIHDIKPGCGSCGRR